MKRQRTLNFFFDDNNLFSPITLESDLPEDDEPVAPFHTSLQANEDFAAFLAHRSQTLRGDQDLFFPDESRLRLTYCFRNQV